MHLRCYQERADVGAVVHAHPPTATGFAVAHLDMDRYNMIETVLTLGSVPVTPTARHPPTKFLRQSRPICRSTTRCC